jgi:pyruvate dehydrogenase E2 component (dihydrolipoamide acetyltransferase)
MPKLGLTMTEGALVEWTLAPGARFSAGDCVFVVENDKAATEVAAESDGVMGAPLVAVGQTVPVGAVVGHWDDGVPSITSAAVADVAEATPTTARRPVTPFARRLAREHQIALADVTGSGPRGRVRARDVEAVMKARTSAPAPAPAPVALPAPATASAKVTNRAPAAAPSPPPAPATLGTAAGRLQPFTAAQQATAARLTAAKQDIPHFYLAREAEVSSLLELCAKLKDPETEPRLTLNHFFVAALGRALRALPELNRIWTPQGALVLDRSDVGVAVHTEHGLRVPIVRDAGRLSLVNLARHGLPTHRSAAHDGRIRSPGGRAIRPRVLAQAGREKAFPKEFWLAVCEAGLCGAALPEAYGGSGLGMFEMALIVETLASTGGGSTVGQLFMINPDLRRRLASRASAARR